MDFRRPDKHTKLTVVITVVVLGLQSLVFCPTQAAEIVFPCDSSEAATQSESKGAASSDPKKEPSGAPSKKPDSPGGKPAGPGMPPGGPPPLGMMLGFADFMITIDRPYEAEKIYKGILGFDPKNAAALAGLRDVKVAKRPTFTLLGHYYEDSYDVKLSAFGGGPTFRTPYGRITMTSGTGHYQNNNNPNNPRNPRSLLPTVPTALDDHVFSKQTYNLILEPYYKKWEGSLFLSQVNYDQAPNRFLYDFKVSFVETPRKRYSISHGRHDSFFQNVNEQFYAPESFDMLMKKTTFRDTSFSIDHPLSRKVDLGFSYRYFNYTDNNERNNFRTTLMYRIKPSGPRPMPILRVGLDAIYDDSRFFTLDYTASVHFNTIGAAVDYIWLSRKSKFGFYASTPIMKEHFNAPGALFALYSRNITRDVEFYAKFGGLTAVGNSLNFGDYVAGFNVRF